MGEAKHVCTHCGGNSVWRNLVDGFKRVFRLKKQGDRLMYIPVDHVDHNPYQPREYVQEEPLEELKKSIEQYGVIVPIIVNRQGKRFTLVAGQRRLAASRELGFKFVPAIVRTLNSRQMMEVSYLENLHREGLSTIDVVQMFDRIHRKYPKIEEGDLADAMGLKVDELRHARNLLDLPIPALEALRAGMITEGHAQWVKEISDPDAQLEVIEMVFNEKLGVEETKELCDRVNHKEASYVTADHAAHFHSPSCPYAQLIPEDRKMKFYSKKEVAKRGKIPCMQCL
ncbi:MAG TPA: ParB/RepB/Spo0J family partition protein [Planctomycetota bacterium]|nr:ParB/RepB/Spo0J family partition protein [Planctomycetota bacterium]